MVGQFTIETDRRFYGDSFDFDSIERHVDHIAIDTMGDEQITLNREAIEAITNAAPDSWCE